MGVYRHCHVTLMICLHIQSMILSVCLYPPIVCFISSVYTSMTTAPDLCYLHHIDVHYPDPSSVLFTSQ